jgi:hypothetical protein
MTNDRTGRFNDEDELNRTTDKDITGRAENEDDDEFDEDIEEEDDETDDDAGAES